MRKTHKHQRRPNHQTILLGDLNSSWLDTDNRGTHPSLHRWAIRTGWQNPSRTLADQDPDARICTNWTSITPVSWIDHILVFQSLSMPSHLGSHLARTPTTISDKHRLYWISFRIPGGTLPPHAPVSTKYHKNSARSPTYSKTNPLKTSTKPTCKNGLTLTHAPLARSTPQPLPARTYNTSVKHPSALDLLASNGNTKSGDLSGIASPPSC
jgi:hypothetical protein